LADATEGASELGHSAIGKHRNALGNHHHRKRSRGRLRSATGKELWRHKGVESNAIPSPVANSEMVFISAGFPEKIAMAIKLGGTGDLKDSVVWKYAKGTAYVPSPILYGDYLYLTNGSRNTYLSRCQNGRG